MTTLYLPPHVLAEDNKRFAERVFRNVTVEDPLAAKYTRMFQAVRPDFLMVRAHNTVDADVPLRPGFYYVLKFNRYEDAPMSVLCVHSHGEWCEPTDRVFERLSAGDLSQHRVWHELERKDRIEEQEAEREKRALNEARREELKDRVNAATRVQVSMNEGAAWSQNNSPAARRDRGARR